MARRIAKPKTPALAEVPAASQALPLPAKLNSPAAGDLAKTLLGLRGSPIEIDASAVSQLGAQSVQVLASAAATWAADGTEFRVVKASPEFCEAMEWLGLSGLFATEAGR